ncbi:MAG: poly-gamma-glutamate biosynthesis protein PgsC [Myxococcales bacterium]|nr:MAG: poly-gamma-glutamate biosynthesis protein PgsC [Myxococcales bacterium]
MSPLALSIGIGLFTSLLFSELLGLAVGGMVVPGYLAIMLHHPLRVALTIGAGVVSFAFVHAISSFTIIYGRRRTVLMILAGYIVGTLISLDPGQFLSKQSADVTVIGYIIPGLIAIWIDRQGLIATLGALVTSSVVVRLLLLLLGLELGS